MDLRGRLKAWVFLVGALVALAYGNRAAGGKPPKDAVYHWNLAVGGIVEYTIVFGVVLAIAWGGGVQKLLALRPPRSWARAAGLAVLVLVVIYVAANLLDKVLHAGREQGLEPTGWDPHRAGAFAANFVVIALLAPIVEELTFRGLGYSLLERFGHWFAIAAVGITFGLAHGLVEALPILAIFGAGLAWLRARTRSVFPGMIVHAAFNSIALVVSVTT